MHSARATHTMYLASNSNTTAATAGQQRPSRRRRVVAGGRNPRYEGLSAIDYAIQTWIHTLAERVATTLNSYRPFTAEDIVIDYGGGPGITLEKIFYIKQIADATDEQRQNTDEQQQNEDDDDVDSSEVVAGADAEVEDAADDGSDVDRMKFSLISPTWRDADSTCRSGALFDISQTFTLMSRQLASYRCPLKGVACQTVTAFKNETSAELSEEFLEYLPAHFHCALSSLTAEYLSTKQIVALTRLLLDRVVDGGCIGWFEWDKHEQSIIAPEDRQAQHNGISIDEWQNIATEILATYKNSSERQYIRHHIGGFALEQADVKTQLQTVGGRVHYQRSPVVNYLILVNTKEDNLLSKS